MKIRINLFLALVFASMSSTALFAAEPATEYPTEYLGHHLFGNYQGGWIISGERLPTREDIDNKLQELLGEYRELLQSEPLDYTKIESVLSNLNNTLQNAWAYDKNISSDSGDYYDNLIADMILQKAIDTNDLKLVEIIAKALGLGHHWGDAIKLVIPNVQNEEILGYLNSLISIWEYKTKI